MYNFRTEIKALSRKMKNKRGKVEFRETMRFIMQIVIVFLVVVTLIMCNRREVKRPGELQVYG